MIIFAIISFCVAGTAAVDFDAMFDRHKYARVFVGLTGSFVGIFFIVCFMCLVILTVLCGLASVAWWLSDWIRILSDDLDDGHGHKLASWN